MDNFNWLKGGDSKTHGKKSKSKRTSPKKRSLRKPSKKQLAALARGRAIRAKNIKKRRSGQNKQRGGVRPLTSSEVMRQQRETVDEEARRAEIHRNRVARVEAASRRQEAKDTAATRIRWPWSRK
jgi:hypothetical protein